MKRYLQIACVTAILVHVFGATLDARIGPLDGRNFRGRIAYSCDGNNRDRDDLFASAVTIAIFSAFNATNKVVHFDYNSILGEDDTEYLKIHEESVRGAAKRFGLSDAVIFNDSTELTAAINNIKGAVNASSPANPLYFVIAGPMEVPWRGIHAADPSKRKYVYCISHTVWNDMFFWETRNPEITHNKRDLIKLGVNWIQIPGQRGWGTCPEPKHGPCPPEKWALWDWMRDSNNSDVAWLYERLKAMGRPDCSDSGMVYFLLCGNQRPDVEDLRQLLHGYTPETIDRRPMIRLEAENFYFDNYTIPARRHGPIVSQRLCAQLTARTGHIRTAFNEIYAASGPFDIEVRYFDGRDGHSEFALFVGGEQRGESWRASADTESWQSRIISDVPVNVGDEIMLKVRGEGTEIGRIDFVQLNYRSGATDSVHPRFTATGSLDDPHALPGQIIVAGTNPGYLKYNGGGPACLCGPDNPETFLFLGDLNPDGTRSGPQTEIIDLIGKSGAKNLKVAVVQTIVEPRLEDNLTKVLGFIDRAKSEQCRLVVLPEHVLLPFEATDKPAKAELDAAFEKIRRRAQSAGICVVFSDGYRQTEGGAYQTHGIVYTEDGAQAVFYRKNLDAPRPFVVDGVSCNLSVCSDRGYLEHSDLPCITLGTQIIIDSSGGHGGDDGGKELPLIRYRPWAARTGAWVIVCNPVHEDTDFMGRSPWGGGSAIIRPDGSVLAALTYEKDTMIVEEIDMDLASRAAAQQRLNHPLFKLFWEQGKSLLVNGSVGSRSNVKPFTSTVRDIKIAAAQMACSRDMYENVQQIRRQITLAAQHKADIVVFPELAVTGNRTEDIRAATQNALDDALDEIRAEAKLREIYVIVGMPVVTGDARYNCAVVIGDDGSVKTRYAQLVASREDLFQSGQSAKSLWFSLKGVPSIVTVGDDANWVEIGDLAANRGMYLHFHISYELDASPDHTTLRKQRNLLALCYARYGVIVNAADPLGLKHPSEPASGMSMIVSREGGHNQPAPKGIEYYLPYQTSVVESAGAGPAMIVATRRTSTANNMDLTRFWRNRNRRQGGQPARLDWISNGAALIAGDGAP